MEPTYRAGSQIWISRIAYLFRKPSRGDVVVVRPRGVSDRLELKRIIGLPRENIVWTGARFLVDGLPLDEPYAPIRPVPPGDDDRRVWRLGPDEYFLAGDNRLYSRDSRAYGSLERAAILGKAVA